MLETQAILSQVRRGDMPAGDVGVRVERGIAVEFYGAQWSEIIDLSSIWGGC